MSFRFFDHRKAAGDFPVDLLPREDLSDRVRSLVEKCCEIPFRENRWTAIFLEEGKISAVCLGSFNTDKTAPVQQVGFFKSQESQGRLLMKTMAQLHKLGYQIRVR